MVADNRDHGWGADQQIDPGQPDGEKGLWPTTAIMVVGKSDGENGEARPRSRLGAGKQVEIGAIPHLPKARLERSHVNKPQSRHAIDGEYRTVAGPTCGLCFRGQARSNGTNERSNAVHRGGWYVTESWQTHVEGEQNQDAEKEQDISTLQGVQTPVLPRSPSMPRTVQLESFGQGHVGIQAVYSSQHRDQLQV